MKNPGYSLHVKYFLNKNMGKQISEVLRIKQYIGIKYLKR